MADTAPGTKPESRAVALARSHLEAWTNHDFRHGARPPARDMPIGEMEALACVDPGLQSRLEPHPSPPTQ